MNDGRPNGNRFIHWHVYVSTFDILNFRRGQINILHVTANTLQLCQVLQGGHSEIVRSTYWDSKRGILYSGGEDAKLGLWTSDAPATIASIQSAGSSSRHSSPLQLKVRKHDIHCCWGAVRRLPLSYELRSNSFSALLTSSPKPSRHVPAHIDRTYCRQPAYHPYKHRKWKIIQHQPLAWIEKV